MKNTKTIKIKNAMLKVVMAETDEQHSKGLMHVKSLPSNHGMLFQYPSEQILSFWMKNTYIPLSIAFIDSDKNIVEIQDMQPNSEEPVSSEQEAMWALETNKGWFERNGISVGDKIKFMDDKLVKIRITKN
jgi:uncharacterized protein